MKQLETVSKQSQPWSFCEQCRKINFSKILKEGIDWIEYDERQHYIHRTPNPNCQLCVFFFRAVRYSSRSSAATISLVDLKLGQEPPKGESPDTGPDQGIIFLAEELEEDWAGLSPPIIVGYHNRGVRARPINPSKVDYQLFGSWISDCVEHHGPSCNKPPTLQLTDFRVIDCGTPTLNEQKLVSYPDRIHPDYVALSYVWGAGTKSPTLPLNSTLPEPIPKVISDAVVVVREMGYRYLWIDRYCIPQEENEMKQQLQMMGHIYEAAVFTIIAAAGNGPGYGLPGVTTTTRPKQPSFRVGGDCLLAPIIQPESEITDSKWATRGWTFQEGILSRRRLVFTKHQVFFQCQEDQYLETVYSSLKTIECIHSDVFRNKVGHDSNPSSVMREYITNYMQRDFTKHDDALNAFRGILQRCKEIDPPVVGLYGVPVFQPKRRYLATMEIPDTTRMVITLSWHLYFPDGVQRRRVFPSWTWLGWRIEGAQKLWPINMFRYRSVGCNIQISEVEPNIIRNHISSLQVAFEDGEFVDWNQAENIYDKSIRTQVHFVRISGWLFDITLLPPGDPYVSARNRTTTNQDQNPWEFVAEPGRGYRGMTIYRGDSGMITFEVSPDGVFSEAYVGRGKHTFTCLLLTSFRKDATKQITSDRGVVYAFLILRPGSKRKRGYFERLACLELDSDLLDLEFEKVDENMARIGRHPLRRGTVKLQ